MALIIITSSVIILEQSNQFMVFSPGRHKLQRTLFTVPKYSILIDDLKTTSNIITKTHMIIKNILEEMEAILLRSKEIKEQKKKEKEARQEEER